jgi:replication fork protection complex subunit Tof1/Swi1
MERSKIRPTDNVRTFYLAHVFIEYLLILRQKAQTPPTPSENENVGGKGKGKELAEVDLPLGLVAEMAELDSVRWVVGRMRLTMDEHVSVDVD